MCADVYLCQSCFRGPSHTQHRFRYKEARYLFVAVSLQSNCLQNSDVCLATGIRLLFGTTMCLK